MKKDIQRHWRDVIINKSATLLFAIKQMNSSALRILLVVDADMRLVGTITDGDIRRHLLKQTTLELPVSEIMRLNPTTAFISESQDQLLTKMRSLGILHLPIIDSDNHVVGLETLDGLFNRQTRENWVIFMAGGMGKRLYPLTAECPKPLLKIGNKPISEILLENFIQCGFKNFFFSVNYKANMIRDYYGSGAQLGINIDYIEENEALGTAGSLSLLPSMPTQSFFVVNADILTKINFGHILDFHREQATQSAALLCVRAHQNAIPFGVVTINDVNHHLINIEEKPIKNYFVNTGVYILEPESLQYLSFNSYCDMPHFLTHLVNVGLPVSTFPIREYWLDIGHHDNLLKAAQDYLEIFA